MTYSIEEDVPAPQDRRGYKSLEREELDKLQPGQSILFPADRAKVALTAANNKHAGDKNWFYTTKKLPDGSRRIWRLSND